MIQILFNDLVPLPIIGLLLGVGFGIIMLSAGLRCNGEGGFWLGVLMIAVGFAGLFLDSFLTFFPGVLPL